MIVQSYIHWNVWNNNFKNVYLRTNVVDLIVCSVGVGQCADYFHEEIKTIFGNDISKGYSRNLFQKVGGLSENYELFPVI